ncbi:hypothetical protein WKS98_03350 [Lagierella sp. ICN-221743]
MIDWEKAQWADKIKIIFTNGDNIVCRGNGISLAEDFDEPEEQYDTFFVINGKKNIALDIKSIKDIVYL